jgi:hypothetical protein
LSDLLTQFQEYGVPAETYRSVVRAQLYRDKLADALAEESDLPDEAEQASFYVLSFATEEEANEALAQIESEDFLTVWNTIRSTPTDPESESTANAFELLWRRQEDLANLGAEAQEAIFDLPLNTPSEILVSEDATTETTTYFIVQVSGREVRPLSETVLETEKRQNLTNFLDTQVAGNLQITEFWRNRVPTQPVLDPKFLAQPTAEPVQQPAPVTTVNP